jgi:hypothetical protein
MTTQYNKPTRKKLKLSILSSIQLLHKHAEFINPNSVSGIENFQNGLLVFIHKNVHIFKDHQTGNMLI